MISANKALEPEGGPLHAHEQVARVPAPLLGACVDGGGQGFQLFGGDRIAHEPIVRRPPPRRAGTLAVTSLMG